MSERRTVVLGRGDIVAHTVGSLQQAGVNVAELWYQGNLDDLGEPDRRKIIARMNGGTIREQIVALLMKSDPAQSGTGALHILTHDIEKIVIDAKNLAEHLVLTGERGPQPAYALDLHVRTERTVREVFERATGLHDRLIHFRFANGCMNCTPSVRPPSEVNTNKECCLHA